MLDSDRSIAVDNGFIVVYGGRGGIIVEGAIHHRYEAAGGRSLYFINGCIVDDGLNEHIDGDIDAFARFLDGVGITVDFYKIAIEWLNGGNTWKIETGVPHASFSTRESMDDEQGIFCHGIVVNRKDLGWKE